MLYAMKAKNLGMHFEYVPKSDIMGPKGRQYFFRAFWTFRLCVEAFKSCCDVLSIDGTFLMGKYEGTMLLQLGSMQTINWCRLLLPSWRRRTTVVGVGFFI
jgi:hypothetical protein